MRKIKFALTILAVLFTFCSFASAPTAGDSRLAGRTTALYQSIDFGNEEKLDYSLFHKAMTGFYQLKNTKKLSDKDIISIIDFRKSGKEKRLWIIDLKHKKLLYHTLVAHGRNSGDDFANKFSNVENSNQSSLGFYVTGKTYTGKHGLSLKLHGMESSNNRAEQRAVVMHGADYVSEGFIQKVGRLGRSFGCPAVSMDLYQEIIPTVAEGTCLFIYYPEKKYLAQTRFNNETAALEYLQAYLPQSL